MYYEYYDSIETAIQREKQFKWWNRKQKLELIETRNPEWDDLTGQVKELM